MNSVVLDDVCRSIGYTPTRYLVAWYGGRQLYVPKLPDEAHPLRRLIGLVPFRALVRDFGDSRLRIPLDREDQRYRRDRRITERLAQGATIGELAQEFGITERWCENIRAEVASRGWLEYAKGPEGRGKWCGHPPPALFLKTGEVSDEPPRGAKRRASGGERPPGAARSGSERQARAA